MFHRKNKLLVVLLLFSFALFSQETPFILHFSRNDYQGLNQNWSLGQSSDGFIFSANSAGLLVADGQNWRKFELPKGQIIRSLSVSSQNKVFTGSVGTFGYWEKDKFGQFYYVDLAGDNLDSLHLKEEFWHILPKNNDLYFQSFSVIYKWKNKKVSKIIPPGNIMFLQKVGNKIVVPVIGKGLFLLNEEDNTFNMVQGVRGSPNLGWGFNNPSDDLVRSYEPGDPRRDATVLYVGEVLPDGSGVVEDNPSMDNERYNQKAWVESHPGLQDNGPGNIRLLRYADVLLIAAESINELNNPTEALKYLNQVRQRARGTRSTVLPDVVFSDKLTLRERIWKERRIELAMEQQRWFDLVRTGQAEKIMKNVGKNFIKGKHELFPIPQTEIDLSEGKMTQNPGY